MKDDQVERLVSAVEKLCELVADVVALNQNLLETVIAQGEDDDSDTSMFLDDDEELDGN